MYRIALLFTMFTLIVDIKCPSPLDEYVYHWDTTFSYKLLQTYPSPTHTVYILNLTSQTWMNSTIIINQSIYYSNSFFAIFQVHFRQDRFGGII